MGKKKDKKLELIKSIHPGRPDFNYLLPKENKKLMRKLSKAQILSPTCPKICTKIITLLPKMSIQPHWGFGYYVINVDGYRYINAYIISDALSSSNQRGFELEISFALNDFVIGVGVKGETRCFFNFDNYYNITEPAKRTIICATSDLTSLGGVPQIGGVDLTHILRVPVMGPYVRASAFNVGETERSVEVKAYLTT